TLKLLRGMGHLCQVVEKWIPQTKRRLDLFDCIDIVSLDVDVPGCLGLQVTSGSNHSTRRAKALASPKARAWVQAGNRLVILSWSKKANKRWEPRWDKIEIGEFAEAAVEALENG